MFQSSHCERCCSHAVHFGSSCRRGAFHECEARRTCTACTLRWELRLVIVKYHVQATVRRCRSHCPESRAGMRLWSGVCKSVSWNCSRHLCPILHFFPHVCCLEWFGSALCVFACCVGLLRPLLVDHLFFDGAVVKEQGASSVVRVVRQMAESVGSWPGRDSQKCGQDDDPTIGRGGPPHLTSALFHENRMG